MATSGSASEQTSKSFALKLGLESNPLGPRDYVDFTSYLYYCKTVNKQQGRVLVLTDPAENGGHAINPGFSNAFVGAIYRAYNEHRHLILRPDDVWLAITTAFGLFMGKEENAETMRKQFVNFEGKMKLEVEDVGAVNSVNWHSLINQMSNLIEKNTKGNARTWLEPTFSTTTPVCKTVGQVVLMGVMKHYFEYHIRTMCGLPKVTLEGTLDDWKKLQEKARHFASFGIECLAHWSGLLDIVLQKMVDSYEGKVDEEFWSHIISRKHNWGSGAVDEITGWVNVFMPFTDSGYYRLNYTKAIIPTNNARQGIYQCTVGIHSIPPSTVEVPVFINDNGRKYETIFYGGHIVCLYNPADDSIRPSLDWAIVDISGKPKPEPHGFQQMAQRESDYDPRAFAKPVKFSYGA